MEPNPNLFDRLFEKDPLNFDNLDTETAAKEYHIKTNYGPEDFLMQTRPDGSERLIISCSRRRKKKKLRKKGVQLGFIDYYDLSGNAKKANTFKIEGYEYLAAMEPHGIAMARHDQQDYLYVITHEKRAGKKVERILKFKIGEDTLYFVYEYGEGWDEGKFSPNDLWVTDEGDIYFTNPRMLSIFYKKHYLGYIRMKKDENGEEKPFYKVLKNNLAFPNGIIRIDDKLYFTTTRQKKKSSLFYYTLQDRETLAKEPKKRVAKIPGGDNIIPVNDELLLVANHPNMWRFIRHGLSAGTHSPSSVFLVDLTKDKKQNAKQIFSSDGTFLNASSTALIHGNYLYVAQVFDNYILKLPLDL